MDIFHLERANLKYSSSDIDQDVGFSAAFRSVGQNGAAQMIAAGKHLLLILMIRLPHNGHIRAPLSYLSHQSTVFNIFISHLLILILLSSHSYPSPHTHTPLLTLTPLSSHSYPFPHTHTPLLTLTPLSSYSYPFPHTHTPLLTLTPTSLLFILGEIFTLPIVVLVSFLAQPRLMYAMASDGLLPKVSPLLPIITSYYSREVTITQHCTLNSEGIC